MNHSYDHSQQFAFEYIKVKSSFTYHCPAVLAPHYDRGLIGSVLSTQWGPGRTGQIEVVKKELCSHVTGSCFALRPGIPVDPLRVTWTQWPGQQQSQTQIYWQPLTYTLPDRWKHAWLTWYNPKKCLRHTQLNSEAFALFLHLSMRYNWCYVHFRCSSQHICKSAVSWKEN